MNSYIFKMAHEWLEYIRKFDNLVEEALRYCVKNSLQTLINVLHGDGTMGPSPLLIVDIDLHEDQVYSLRIYLFVFPKKIHFHAVNFLTEHQRGMGVPKKPSKHDHRNSKLFPTTLREIQTAHKERSATIPLRHQR